MSASDDLLIKNLRKFFHLKDFVNNVQKQAVRAILTRKSIDTVETHYVAIEY